MASLESYLPPKQPVSVAPPPSLYSFLPSKQPVSVAPPKTVSSGQGGSGSSSSGGGASSSNPLSPYLPPEQPVSVGKPTETNLNVVNVPFKNQPSLASLREQNLGTSQSNQPVNTLRELAGKAPQSLNTRKIEQPIVVGIPLTNKKETALDVFNRVVGNHPPPEKKMAAADVLNAPSLAYSNYPQSLYDVQAEKIRLKADSFERKYAQQSNAYKNKVDSKINNFKQKYDQYTDGVPQEKYSAYLAEYNQLSGEIDKFNANNGMPNPASYKEEYNKLNKDVNKFNALGERIGTAQKIAATPKYVEAPTFSPFTSTYWGVKESQYSEELRKAFKNPNYFLRVRGSVQAGEKVLGSSLAREAFYMREHPTETAINVGILSAAVAASSLPVVGAPIGAALIPVAGYSFLKQTANEGLSRAAASGIIYGSMAFGLGEATKVPSIEPLIISKGKSVEVVTPSEEISISTPTSSYKEFIPENEFSLEGFKIQGLKNYEAVASETTNYPLETPNMQYGRGESTLALREIVKPGEEAEVFGFSSKIMKAVPKKLNEPFTVFEVTKQTSGEKISFPEQTFSRVSRARSFDFLIDNKPVPTTKYAGVTYEYPSFKKVTNFGKESLEVVRTPEKSVFHSWSESINKDWSFEPVRVSKAKIKEIQIAGDIQDILGMFGEKPLEKPYNPTEASLKGIDNFFGKLTKFKIPKVKIAPESTPSESIADAFTTSGVTEEPVGSEFSLTKIFGEKKGGFEESQLTKSLNERSDIFKKSLFGKKKPIRFFEEPEFVNKRQQQKFLEQTGRQETETIQRTKTVRSQRMVSQEAKALSIVKELEKPLQIQKSRAALISKTAYGLSSALISKTVTRQKSYQEQNVKSILGTALTQKVSERQVPITKAISGLTLKSLTEQKAIQETKLSQRAVQEQIAITRPSTKMPPPPVPPPPLYGGFGLPPGVSRSRKKPLMFFKKSPQQKKYTPSFAAEALHISAAKAPKRLSGFEIRPIIKRRIKRK